MFLRSHEIEKETIMIKKYLRLTEVTSFLNKYFGKKRSGKNFTDQDVQQYIYKTGHLPRYLGNFNIQEMDEIKKMYIITQEKITKKI